MKSLLARLTASRPVAAWQRFGRGRGAVLSGGITYAAFFSLFPALAAGFTIFALVLGNRVELQEEVVEAVNETVGTPIIKIEPDDPGIVMLSSLTNTEALTITGLVALVALLITGLGWLSALREATRAMFGQPVARRNFVVAKLRDILVLLLMGLIILASALSGVAVNSIGEYMLEVVGLDGSAFGSTSLQVAGALVVAGVDFVILLLVFRYLAGIRLPIADLLAGAAVGAVVLGVIKFFAGFLLSRLGGNEFLAAFAVAVGLLIWLNLIARVVLLAAAWGAVTAVERGHLLDQPTDDPFPTEPVTPVPAAAAAAASAVPVGPVQRIPGRAGTRPSPARPSFVPVVGTRSADRVSVAAGAVLGAAGAVSVRVLADGLRTVAGAFRRDGDDRDD